MASKIRIKKVPPGLDPEYIRQQWVGIEMPISSDIDLGSSKREVKINEEKKSSYAVDIDAAIVSLINAGKLETASYWSKQKYEVGNYIRFNKDCCEVIYNQVN